MRLMKRRSCLLLSLCWWAFLLQGCSPSEADLAEECTVNFTAGMQMTGEWEPGEWVTRADESLAEGTTVRVLVYKGSSTAAADYLKECTYKVVSGALTRCAVNADGTVNSGGTAPADLTLLRGSYTCYAVSPAVTVNHAGNEPTASVTHGMDVAVAQQTVSVTTLATTTTVALSLTRLCCRLNFITDRVVGTAVDKVAVQSVTLTDMASTPQTLTGVTALAKGVPSSSSVKVPGNAFVTDGTSAWKQTGHTLALPKSDGTFKLKVSAKLNSLSVARDYEASVSMAFSAAQAYNFTLKFNGIGMEVIQSEQWEDVPEGGDVFGGNSNNLSKNGTANCYIVTDNTAQEYRFDARVRGNGYESTTDPNVSSISYGTLPSLYDGKVARVIWQTGTDASTLLIDPASLRLQYGKVYFKTTGLVNKGNAVIGIFASSADNAPCLWSWHIWKLNGTVPADVTCQKYLNGNTDKVVSFKMMPLNLGAFTNAQGDVGSMGLIYKWGRKDPFPTSSGFNNRIELSNIYGSYCNNGTPGSWSGKYSIPLISTSGIATEAWRVQYPTVYPVTGAELTIDQKGFWGTPWKAGGYNEYNGNQGTKSIYDPCPVGYRVPPQDTWSKSVAGSIVNNGATLTGIVASDFIWLPLVNARYGSAGNLCDWEYINYWTSSPYSGDPTNNDYGVLQIRELARPSWVFRGANGGRCYPIRCVAE